MLIANRFVLPSSTVLDVGCGRGFFTFACAKRARFVLGLDLMDGNERVGWWKEFSESAVLLKVDGRIAGARACASNIPVAGESFDLVATVHAIRNFGAKREIKTFFSEAMRVLRRGGRILLVETDLEARPYRAYRAFYALRVKLGWELKLPPFADMIKWLKEVGFSGVSARSIETGLRYAPLYLPFDRTTMKDVEDAYHEAARLRKKEGDRHPPIIVITGTKR